ncbi:hypothetical protein SPONN_867 [uncultured Candidatus Thioglobus sp.]|nr:hypothetical protein SPONN_867 [uncultured Candidatus Thioglobus sp.]
MIKDKAYYLAIDYDIITHQVSETDGGGYLAYYSDIEGVMGDGDTRAQAIKEVKSAFNCYLEVALANQDKIFEPENLTKCKKINISMPIGKIKNLDIYAKQLGTSRSGLLTMLSDKLLNGDITFAQKK